MSRYVKRLDRDLVRWREAGWINADGETAIRRDLATTAGSKLDLATALGILGAVLIGFGAMSFVAAHWSEMPRLFRLALIFGALFASYGIAGVLFERKHPTFAHAAILAGVSMFGAGIMLIAQMFHIEGHPPDAVLTWALGALAAGVILKSNPALAVAMLLVCLWSGWELIDNGWTHWPFLLGWGAVTAAIVWQRWNAGLHLAAVALALWIVSLGYTLFDGNGHGVVVGLGLLVAAAGVAGPVVDDRLSAWSTSIIAYGMSIAYAGLFALQFVKSLPLDYFILLAILSLALVLGGIALGLKLASPALLWLGYAGFSIEVLGIYFKTVGTLLGSSFFFLSAGALVILLSFVAYRLHARVKPGLEPS
ncbi:MAG: DUF2157 domain-containing protein [Hyphomicrobium sp.]|jgi:uncharacterized membrane protein